jgi:hypothetical protein
VDISELGSRDGIDVESIGEFTVKCLWGRVHRVRRHRCVKSAKSHSVELPKFREFRDNQRPREISPGASGLESGLAGDVERPDRNMDGRTA